MKRFGILLAMLMVMGMAKADPITQKKASRLALTYMENQLEEPMLIKKATRQSRKKLAASYETAYPYYIYSRGEGKGFVIVSGDDALPEVLGYTESGDFDEGNMPPFLKWYLDYYATLVEAAQSVGAGRMETPSYATGRVDVKPLLSTHWHQDSPYNNLCPTQKGTSKKCVTGCVATAASQILYYWHKDMPAYTQAATTSYTGTDADATTAFPKGTALMWDLMREEYGGSEPTEYKNAVATLMAVVGGAAHLTYADATSGYTQDCCGVFKNYFAMNGGTCYVKDRGTASNEYTDAAWATLLYNDLVKGRPIEYSGCNDNGEGHAVVVDGYQASTGYFHFNLGWGNPSAYDGYFTVARGKSPSWGFNSSWQEAIVGAYPAKQNLKGSMNPAATIYKDRTNTVRVKIENHGTLDYSGIYLFGSTNDKKPTSLGSSKSYDKTTVIPNDGSEVMMKLEFKPTADTYYLYVTDDKLNVLAKTTVEAVAPNNDLWLKDISICGSKDKDGDYCVVYNEKTQATAILTNRGTSDYEGTVRTSIYGSSDNGATFKLVGEKTAKIEIPAMGEATALFSLTSTSGCPIKIDSLYRVVMNLETKSDNLPIHMAAGTDSIARFILKGADMEVVSFEEGCLTLKGHWDPLLMTTYMKKNAYKKATCFDLTQVTSIDEITESPVNPNALFYVVDKSVKGNNVICDGECKSLMLTPGYDYTPKATFTAVEASIDINQVANKWNLLTAPCTVNVPEGMVARNIESHTSSGINNKTTNVRILEGGKTYLLISSSSKNQYLTGSNTQALANTEINTDKSLVGRLTNGVTPSGAFLIDMEEQQYFQPVDSGTSVEALRGYFCPSNIKKAFKAYANITSDPTYQVLGQAIETAYQTIDNYNDIVTDAAYRQLMDSVRKAEQIYTAREYKNLQVKLVATNLLAAAEQYKQQVVDPRMSEIDCTSYIKNPSFESGNAEGWTLEQPTMTSAKQATSLNYRGVGADGSYLLYSINTSTFEGFGISQTIEGLRPGYYRLTAMLGSGKEKTITLFANDSVKTISSHPFGQFYMTEAVIEDVFVGQGESLTIGVKSGDWYKADDFRLYCTANDPTGIADVVDKKYSDSPAGVFDLTGRRIDVESIKRGIYIKQGKKMLKK